jgi:hypothetical protein
MLYTLCSVGEVIPKMLIRVPRNRLQWTSLDVRTTYPKMKRKMIQVLHRDSIIVIDLSVSSYIFPTVIEVTAVTVTEKNKEHFNSAAKSYDTKPYMMKLASQTGIL